MAQGPTTSSAAPQHPAVTPSQPSNAQSQPRSTAFPSAPADDVPSRDDDPAASSQPTAPAGSHALPAPLPAPEPDGASTTTTVEVNGARVSLADKLGPVVVNEDGTMSRIANWAEMAEIERRNTLRILGKRNKLRLETLRGQGSAPTSTS